LEYSGNEIIQDEFNLHYIEGSHNNEIPEQIVKNENKINLGDDNMFNLVITCASLLGFLFQTSDDFLDMEEDAKNAKPNICNLLGINDSIKLISKCITIIHALFDYIIKNAQQIWPEIVIDNDCIKSVIYLIELRFQENQKDCKNKNTK
jgi:hypothetical protein